MSRHVEVDASRCTGCRACMLSCSLHRTGEARLSGAAIRVVSAPDERAHAPIVCLSCEERLCVTSCNFGALQDIGDTPILDPDLCVGCGACVGACPFGAIHLDPTTGKPIKCDLCDGDPLCVKVCNAAGTMPGALSFAETGRNEDSMEQAKKRLGDATSWLEGETR